MDDFAELCQRHIEREESELLPMAARLLTNDDIARVGQAMRKRRGIAGVQPAARAQRSVQLHARLGPQ